MPNGMILGLETLGNPNNSSRIGYSQTGLTSIPRWKALILHKYLNSHKTHNFFLGTMTPITPQTMYQGKQSKDF